MDCRCEPHGAEHCDVCEQPPYDVGDVAQLVATFCARIPPTFNKQRVDPGAVTLTVLAPDNSQTVYVYNTDPEVTRVSQGQYQGLVSCALPGIYKYRWAGTGTNPGVGPGSFRVRTPAF